MIIGYHINVSMLNILLDYLFDGRTEVKIVADISDLGYTEVKINVN